MGQHGHTTAPDAAASLSRSAGKCLMRRRPGLAPAMHNLLIKAGALFLENERSA